MDKLRSIYLFTVVCEAGSFAKASQQLGTSPSTISKAISRLETALGCALFHRSTRQLRLTEQGYQYLKSAKSILNELNQCESKIKNSTLQVSGVLKINLPVSYGRLYIQPLLKDFCLMYPDIQLDITYDDGYVDLITNAIDISVRSGSVQDSSLIVKKLSPMDFLTCASKSYIDSHGIPNSIDELVEHRWIRFRFRQTGKVFPVMYLKDGEIHHLDPDQSIIVDSGEAMSELCSDGLGITQVPHFLARKWVLSEQIKSVLPCITHEEFGVYFILGYQKKIPTKVRVFIDYIQTAIEQMGKQHKQPGHVNFKI